MPTQEIEPHGGVASDELADITREARTELSAIDGYSEILIEDLVGSNPSAQGDLEKIRGASSRVLSLVARLEQYVNHARAEASRDPLTGIANRRTFESRCGTLFGADPDVQMSVVLIDLDKFKIVNDTYGHLVGDQVLQAVVERTRHAIRESDLLARLAGDEFVVLLPATPPGLAFQVADRIRSAVASSPVSSSKGQIEVSVSVGVATRRLQDRTVNDLVDRADRSMYAAKHGGRDQVASLRD